jgi:hypothetical protein
MPPRSEVDPFSQQDRGPVQSRHPFRALLAEVIPDITFACSLRPDLSRKSEESCFDGGLCDSLTLHFQGVKYLRVTGFGGQRTAVLPQPGNGPNVIKLLELGFVRPECRQFAIHY